MRLLRHYTDVADSVRGAVAAIGNFDGLHLGHQAVIGEAGRLAHAAGRPWGVVTFEPHPYAVFHPEAAPFRLTPFRIKAALLDTLGLDVGFFLPFDEALHTRPPEAFADDILVDGLGLAHVVVGEDFAFGHRRAGDVATLAAAARRHGFGLSVFSKITDDAGLSYSSTKVRHFLASGQPHLAARLLGRAWNIEGRVEGGDRRGRTIGFPTANIALGDHLVPAHGVYAVRAAVVDEGPARWIAGVANLGRRPTVDGKSLLLEVHLLDGAPDLYGRHLRVALIEFVRPEKKFDGLDALRAQIARDCEQARRVLASDQTPLAVGDRAPPPGAVERIV